MLNLNGLIEFWSSVNNTSKTEAKRDILKFVDTYKDATIKEGGINIIGFLKSEVVDVPAKTARNPKTGELVSIPPKKVVKVKVSSKFKNMTEE